MIVGRSVKTERPKNLQLSIEFIKINQVFGARYCTIVPMNVFYLQWLDLH
jgi:hypothetical protein